MIFARGAISMVLTYRPRFPLLFDKEEALTGTAVTVGDEGARADKGGVEGSLVSSDKYIIITISAISNRLFPIAHLCDQCNANIAKETEAKSFGVEVVNSWKNGGIKVSFMSDDEYVIITISVISY